MTAAAEAVYVPARPRRPPAARRIIRCPECGDTRDVSARHARRIAAGEHPALCDWCRQEWQPPAPTDADLVYWLLWAGRHVPEGGCPRAYCRVYGVPAVIVEIDGAIASVLSI